MAERRPERTVQAVPRFLRSKRGFSDEIQQEIDAQVRAILADPLIGDPKAGPLRGVRVFKVGRQQDLLAYRFFPKPNVVEVLDIGPHENFYRDLNKYLDAR